jgi:hypothetical protein
MKTPMKYVLGPLSVLVSIGIAVSAAPALGSSSRTASTDAAAFSVPAESVAASTASPLTAAPASVPTPASAYPIEHVQPVSSPSAVATTKAAPVTAVPAAAAASTVDANTAYIIAMYEAVVPAGERAALAGRYVVGYDLPSLSCGTGCTGMFGAQARSSFDAAFFAQSKAYQRNTIAHEAAHAYGFLVFANYATPSWATVGGWQAAFNAADRSFAGKYDAEAWAACVAWQESGFNNLVNQISHVCTTAAAALAVAQIS